MKRVRTLLFALAPTLGLAACTGDIPEPAEPEVYAGWCSEVTEDDQGRTTREQTFDAEERILGMLEYRNGALAKKIAHQYNGLSIETTESGADDLIQKRTVLDFLEDGRPLFKQDVGGETEEGDPIALAETWRYTPEGKLAELARDVDGDEVADHIETHGAWTEGDYAGLRYKSIDYDGDGVFTHRLTFNAENRIVFEERDWDFNGSFADEFDQTIKSQFDGSDLVARDVAFNGTGIVGHETWQYEDGLAIAYSHTDPSLGVVLAKTELSTSDLLRVSTKLGPNDTLIYREVEFLDIEGRPVVREIDEDGDGAVDQRVSWEYDDLSRLTARAEDHDGDGTDDIRVTWQYDEHDQITREAEDNDGDGTPNRIDEYVFSDHAQVSVERHDSDGDGVWDEHKTWDYDQAGNILKHHAELTVSGTKQVSTSTYKYGCWK